ncbi:MAG: FtsX-like permease family protein [Bacteroidota bacterium]
MIRYILKLGFRNLQKSKGNTFINLLSLTLGFTILILIAVFVQNELSIDNFHSNSSIIYKLSYGKSSGTPGPLSSLLKNNFPEIKDATHIETHQLFALSPALNYNNNAFEIEDYYSADSSFFNIFDFQVIQGNITEALSTPFSIILTESEANRIFKNEVPLGKSITWKTFQDFTFNIKAIVKEPPQNSSIQFKGLISEASVKKMTPYYPENWGFTVYETYLLLQPNVNPSKLEKKLKNYLIEFYNTNMSNSANHADAQLTPLRLHSLGDVYFNKYLINDTTNNGNLFLIKVLIIIGILIMTLSIINYVNLTTARASLRNMEIGVQKVFGSGKSTLIFQFLTETTIISFFALLISFLFTLFLLPLFSEFMGFERPLKFPFVFFLIAIPWAILIGIISGLYPAFFLSSQKVIDILKKNIGNFRTGIKLRYALVVFQFFISISLITLTLLVFKQINYVKNKNLGFDKEHIIYAKLPFELMGEKKDVLRGSLYKLPFIENIAFSSTIPGKIEGLNSQVIDGRNVNFASVWVDPEFIELYDLQLKRGRFFSKEYKSDINSTALINEAAVRAFNIDNPFKLEIRVPGGKAKVIGVVKDFNFKSLHHPIEPISIVYLPRQGAFINIKLKGGNISNPLADIEKVWKELSPETPFSYHFLDSTHDQLYKNEEKMGKAISLFSMIAILIAILGILSLSIFLCESKIKEIGIRKINGAKTREIVLLLNKGLVFNLLVAFIISCPFSLVIIRNWLDNFAYKTSIDPWIFIASGLIVGIISLSIVIWQTWKFAIMNPVETLRYE